MKIIYTLLLVTFCGLCHAQSLGDKVTFEAADGKSYSGKITQIEGEKYKIKYEGFDFESWLLKTQFTVIEERTETAATLQAPSPELPPVQTQPLAVPENPQPAATGANEQVLQNTSGNGAAMSRADSLKMAITNMKTAFEAASKLFVGKSDTLTITIPDIEYENAGLIRLKESLAKIKGARSVVMRYSESTAQLDVTFKGKASELWDNVPTDIRMMFKLVEVSENNITLKYK